MMNLTDYSHTIILCFNYFHVFLSINYKKNILSYCVGLAILPSHMCYCQMQDMNPGERVRLGGPVPT